MFNEGTGISLQDASGNGNTGTLVGSAQWVTGREGSSLSFSSNQTYISVPSLNPFNGAFTVTAWVKFGGLNRGRDNPILGFGTAIPHHGLSIMEKAGHAYFAFYNDDLAGTVPLQANQWTHLAFVCDGQQQFIYVNGLPDASRACSAFLGSGPNLTLGTYPWEVGTTAKDFLLGQLDDVKIYNVALSPVEVFGAFSGNVGLSLTPALVTLGTGQSQAFNALVTGTANPAVTWSLPDPQSGVITTGGVYTAPLTVPYNGITYHVQATSGADPTQSATALVEVSAPLQVEPQGESMPVLGELAFKANVPNGSAAAVTWSVQEAGGGTITNSGLYTAPPQVGTYHILATTIAAPIQTASAAVNVGPAGSQSGNALVLWLPMDEGSGTLTQDASGRGSTSGALVNGPVWVPGKFNSALSFSQPASLLSLTPSVALGSAWTLSCWFLAPLPTTTDWHSLVHGSYKSGDHLITVSSDQVSLGAYQDSLPKFWDSGFKMTSLGAGWHHMAAVGSGGTTQIYVDGIATPNLIPWQSQSNLGTVGNMTGASYAENFGTIDDLRVYNRAMGAAEISGLFLSVVNVVVKPSQASINLGQSQTFAAFITGSLNNEVTWELPDPNSGTITVAGVYTAPTTISADGTLVHILARSKADPTQTAVVGVVLHLPVVITPGFASVVPGGTATFTASTNNLGNQAVTWSANGGTITPNGVFTAPMISGFYTITATSLADPTKSGTVQVYVPLVVSVIPSSSTVLVGGPVVYRAQVLGGSDGRVDWSVLEANGGTITPDGMYKAPNQTGTFHVNAMSLVDPKSATMAQVKVVQDILYQVDPGYVCVNPGGQVTFKLMGFGASTTTVTWQAQGGTITPAGVYTAPTEAGTYIVSALFTTDVSRIATATVLVVDGSKITVNVNPSQSRLNPGETVNLNAQVQGTPNTNVVWSCSAGTIDQAGTYTAPGTVGQYTVTATSEAAPDSFAQATITVEPASGNGTTRSFAYDANGNMISDGNRTFEWDAENRLVSVTILATGHRSEFQYDGFGRRVCIRELDPDQSQNLQVASDNKYLWDGLQIAEKRTTDGGAVLQRFYAQGFMDSDGTVLFYTKDHLGSVRELTDGTQAIRARYDYDPYGRMTKTQGDRDSLIGFAGYFWHAQSGLNLTLFRAFDANSGRWISRDPIGESGGIDLYGYCYNRPNQFIDGLGLDPDDPPGGMPLHPGSRVIDWVTLYNKEWSRAVGECLREVAKETNKLGLIFDIVGGAATLGDSTAVAVVGALADAAGLGMSIGNGNGQGMGVGAVSVGSDIGGFTRFSRFAGPVGKVLAGFIFQSDIIEFLEKVSDCVHCKTGRGK